MDKQTEYVLHHRGARHPLRAAVVQTCWASRNRCRSRRPNARRGLRGGIGFDGSAIEGFSGHRVRHAGQADPSSFQILPWRGDDMPVARLFCDILLPDGSPSYADPRWVSQAAAGEGGPAGIHVLHPPRDRVLPVRRDARTQRGPVPVDNVGYFDHSPHPAGQDFRRQAIATLEHMGISVEFSHHEGAPGQQEIDLRYADALTTGGQHHDLPPGGQGGGTRARCWASFIPKPFTDHPGSGCTHSLPRATPTRSSSPVPICSCPVHRPAVHRGLLVHAPEITAVTNQWINSCKRPPVAWRHRVTSAGGTTTVPRSSAVADVQAGEGSPTRIEFRSWTARPTRIWRTR